MQKRIRELEIVRSVTEAVYPDKDFLAAIARGENPRVVDKETVALDADFIQFSRLTAAIEDPLAVAEFMQSFMTGFNQIADRNRGKVSNFTGDGAFVIWNGRLGPSKSLAVRERILMAINTAIELAQLADFLQHPMRFGISVGQTVTYAIPADSTGVRAFPVTTGNAMNLATRIEASMRVFQNAPSGPPRSLIGIDGRCIDLLREGGTDIPPHFLHIGEMTEKTDKFDLYRILLTEPMAAHVQEVADTTERFIRQSSGARTFATRP